ncbi:hypothetical protein AAFC00_000610 [Neodothiora populina]|uniref:Urease accessory protein UreD n=1 Tax=Neodothiora populina TaxID=2781224 RepID=A0ABR3PDF3_9PEZI
MHNPFLSTPTQKPGHGSVHLALLPPATPVLQNMTYQYPLKLISPAPLTLTWRGESDHGQQESGIHLSRIIHTLYLLTYGGGIVAGDEISLSITLAPQTHLVLLTQGSTKIFKSPRRDLLSCQNMAVSIAPGASLVYLPDPVQPFERSCFRQEQVYNLLPPGSEGAKRGNLCVLDWASRGRAANGEDWTFWTYASKNEIHLDPGNDSTKGSKRLLLRDSLLLEVGSEEDNAGSISKRMDGMGVFGTLIIYGPLFDRLGAFFMDEFKSLPRIGGRGNWDTGSGDEEEPEDNAKKRARAVRQRRETVDGVLWSSAAVRGCVLVKFGAREVEGARNWLRSMLEFEGTVVDQFGERALMCLR